MVKDEAPDFDALARQHIERRRRIVEGAVRRESSPAVGERIEALDQQRLISLHLRHKEPAVRRAVSDGELEMDLAAARRRRTKR